MFCADLINTYYTDCTLFITLIHSTFSSLVLGVDCAAYEGGGCANGGPTPGRLDSIMVDWLYRRPQTSGERPSMLRVYGATAPKRWKVPGEMEPRLEPS